jgi:hypothetical protein
VSVASNRIVPLETGTVLVWIGRPFSSQPANEACETINKPAVLAQSKDLIKRGLLSYVRDRLLVE